MKVFAKWAVALLFAAFLAAAPFALEAAFLPKAYEAEAVGVLVVWHIDSFEGGKGSRRAFLEKTAASFEAAHEGLYVSIINHTNASAETSVQAGNVPDVISFGTGLSVAADIAKPLKTHKNGCFFNSGALGGTACFYPYAYGMYLKFTRSGEGSVVSRGADNFSRFALLLAGVAADEELPPSEACARFASGKAGVLYGTQRDVYRLSGKNVEYSVEPLGTFTDLVQYVAATSLSDARLAAAKEFCEYLISDEVQRRLAEIGLFSPTGAAVSYGVPEMDALKAKRPTECFSPFVDAAARLSLMQADGQEKFLEKFRDYLEQ